MAIEINIEGDNSFNKDNKDDGINNIDIIKEGNIKIENEIQKNNEEINNNKPNTNKNINNNEMDKMGDMKKIEEVQDNNINEDVARKLVRKYVKAYDPRKDQDGNIISNSKTVLQST